MKIIGINDYVENGQEGKIYKAKLITIHLDEGTNELIMFHGHDAPESHWSDIFETKKEFDENIAEKKALKVAFEKKVVDVCKASTGLEPFGEPTINYLYPSDFLCVVWWYN